MTGFSSSAVISRAPKLVFSQVNRDLVILHVGKGAYFSFDEIGADIWRRIESPLSIAALCDDLVKEYEADIELIERDVLALFEDMAAAELITVMQP